MGCAPEPTQATLGRVLDSADYLAEHLHKVPIRLVSVADTSGTDFKPAPRMSLGDSFQWDRW